MESLSHDEQQANWHPQPPEFTPPPEDRDRLTPTERLEAARPQLEQLVAAMAPDIRAGRWDALLGDDVSGRLPTLILRRIITRAYAAQGRPAPATYFVAMGQDVSYIYDDESSQRIMDVRDYLISGPRPKRVLFITDNIALGGSIQTVQEILDDMGVRSDVASAQEKASLVENVSGHVPYDLPAAYAVVDDMARQGRVHSAEERFELLREWSIGVRHGARDPEAKYYGVENPVTGPVSQPFHLAPESRPHSRSAIGVEKYGRPVTEGVRHHALRQLHDGQLQPDERVPPNPQEAQLRQAALKLADELYHQLVA
jgi:hypothetical protein